MPQALDLMDMLKNRQKEQPQAAPGQALKALRETARSLRSVGYSMPVDPSQAKPAGGTSHASFQDRVKESHAKLNRKSEHHFFPQNKPAPSAKPEGASRPVQPKAQTQAQAQARPPENPQAAELKAEKCAPKGQPRTRREAKAAEPAPATPTGPAVSREPAVQVASLESLKPDGDNARMDAETTEELLSRLEELGIPATQAQVQDPTFLMGLLMLLQSGSDAATAVEVGAPGPALATDPTAPALSALPAITAIAANPAKPATGLETLSSESGTGESGLETFSMSVPMADAATGAAPDSEPALPGTLPTKRDGALEHDVGKPSKGPGPLPEAAVSAIDSGDVEELTAAILNRLSDLEDAGTLSRGIPALRPLSAFAGRFHALEAAQESGRSPLSGSRPAPEVLSVDKDVTHGLDDGRLRLLQIPGVLQGKVPAEAGLVGAREPTVGQHPEKSADRGEPVPPWAALGVGAGEDAGDSDHGLTDLFGKQPEGSLGQNGSPLRDGPVSGVRDNSPVQTFHGAMDQARAADIHAPKHAAPPAPASGTPAADHAMLSQIVKKMSALAHKGLGGAGEMSIHLEPEHLGKMRIALEMRDGTLAARIGVENDQVRQLVDANLSSLRDTLEGQGIKLLGLEVSVDQKHASLFNPDGSSAESFFRRKGRDDASSRSLGADALDDIPAESDTGRRWGYNTLEFIA